MKNCKLLYLAIIVLLCSVASPSFGQTEGAQINHVAICTHNLKKSTAFYTDVIGLQKIPNPFHDTVHQWIRIGPGIALHIIEANCPPEAHDINTHLCFSVKSLTDFMKHLDQYQVKYGDWNGNYKKTQHRADGVTQIYFQDPDGYWIEVNDDNK
jgi:lactoylglutathione lyase